MVELSAQQCRNLSTDESALDEEQTRHYLQQLDPQWQLNDTDKTISHSYTFKDFYQTMAFVNVVAQIAHQQDHHPDLQVSYNRCTVTYSTHSVGGLSVNDFICAAKINAAVKL